MAFHCMILFLSRLTGYFSTLTRDIVRAYAMRTTGKCLMRVMVRLIVNLSLFCCKFCICVVARVVEYV